MEQIEEHESHVPTTALALSEDCLDTLMTITSTRLTVEHC
jgi:hypothetical protein